MYTTINIDDFTHNSVWSSAEKINIIIWVQKMLCIYTKEHYIQLHEILH